MRVVARRLASSNDRLSRTTITPGMSSRYIVNVDGVTKSAMATLKATAGMLTASTAVFSTPRYCWACPPSLPSHGAAHRI